MNIHLHNTKSGKKELFIPLNPEEITIYVCGPTVYDRVHIGNGRPAVVFDVLVRLLRLIYPSVRYVRNITDVDDKINKQAIDRGLDIGELTEHNTRFYQEDVRNLGVLEPTVEPRATNHIDEIIDMIGRLIKRNHAYESQGHVLFDVPSDKSYGQLSHRSLEDMIDGARVEVAPYKKDPKDFILWKPSTPELPGWESPWGRGRPGWHIECSAMIHKHLGTTIDIHGGGNDLTFPHHENELAQGTCIEDSADYVRYWLHNGMLTTGTEKMSKSLGNIVTIHDLLKRHDGEVLRYALLSGHYRQSLVWEERLLNQAKASLDSLYQAIRNAGESLTTTSNTFERAAPEDYPSPVLEALADDLNTPNALAAMHALANEINRSKNQETTRSLVTQLFTGGRVLGLLTQDVQSYFEAKTSIEPHVINSLIEQREQARKDGDFKLADQIRDNLAGEGIELEDTREGTRWRVV